jgi:bacteriorhodopsin
MREETYYPKQWKTFLLLLICVVFTAIGILVIRKGDNRGYLCAIFVSLLHYLAPIALPSNLGSKMMSRH